MNREERQLAWLRNEHRRRRDELRRAGTPDGATDGQIGIGDGGRVRGVPMPGDISGPLGALVRSQGWSGPLALVQLRRSWGELVGPALADRSEPDTVHGSMLKVRVVSPAWATEVRMQSRQLLRIVNQRANLPFDVTEIEVVVGALRWGEVEGHGGPHDA